MFEEKKELMKYIAKLYLEEIPKEKLEEKHYYETHLKFKRYIDTVLYFLEPEYALIIRNDFLMKRKKKWWITHFNNQSEYYRKKAKAVIAFIDCVTL